MEGPRARPPLLLQPVRVPQRAAAWQVPPVALLSRPSSRIMFCWYGAIGSRMEPILKLFSVPVGNQASPTTPFSLRNVSKRLGALPAALALRGDMASRNGSAIATPPAPRSRARRLMGDFMEHLLCC